MNASALLIANPIVIYSTLGFYGLIIVAVLLYVYRKFSGATLLLESLRKDWETADLDHTNLLKQAKEHVSKLAPQPSPSGALAVAGPRSVNFDTRNQVIAMGRKGFTAADISRACAMPESDIDVLLGLARLQR
jgi:hypothetical protein